MHPELEEALRIDPEELLARVEDQFVLTEDPKELDDLASRLLEYSRHIEFWGPNNMATQIQRLHFLIDAHRVDLVLRYGYLGHFGFHLIDDPWNHFNVPNDYLSPSLREIRLLVYSVLGKGFASPQDQEQYHARIIHHINGSANPSNLIEEQRYWEATSTANQAFEILNEYQMSSQMGQRKLGAQQSNSLKKKLAALTSLHDWAAVPSLQDAGARQEWQALADRCFNYLNKIK